MVILRAMKNFYLGQPYRGFNALPHRETHAKDTHFFFSSCSRSGRSSAIVLYIRCELAILVDPPLLDVSIVNKLRMSPRSV